MACRATTLALTILDTAAQPASGRMIQDVWVLFGALTIVLLLLFLGIAFITLARRRRHVQRPRRPAPAPPPIDPWEEAGRRIKPSRRRGQRR